MDNNVVFLKGFKTVLRPLRKETDIEPILRWFNDTEVTRYLLMGSRPLSYQEEVEWMDKRHQSLTDMVLAIETLDGKYIGNIGFHNINHLDRTATSGTSIGEKEYWGRGYGTDAKMSLLYHAFYSMNLRKINSAAIAYNKRSINYSLGCGYKIEGVRKQQIFKEGAYHDEVLLALFKEDFDKAWKKYQKRMKKIF